MRGDKYFSNFKTNFEADLCEISGKMIKNNI